MNYQKQATDFLTKAKATIKIELAKNQSSPLWAKPGADHGLTYNITIERENRKPWTFSYWGSIADKEAINLLDDTRATITNKAGKRIFEYEAGYYSARHDYKKRVEAGEFNPTAYDVLACLTKYNPGTFADFCASYGYEEDSWIAEKTFLAVIEEWNHCEAMFGDIMEELADIN